MNISNKTINWHRLIFIIFISAYALLMLIKPNLAPTDDYVFLRTLQDGKPLLYYSANPPPGYDNLTKTGRLAILGDAEYNLPLLFSKSPSPFWYYLIHAFQYVVLMIIFVKIMARFTSSKFLIYIAPVLLSLFPGMAIAFFRTHIAERNMIFYYAIFLYFYLKYLEKPKLHYLVFGIISANLVIHIKENAFIALGAFTFFHLLLSWKKSRPLLKADAPQTQKTEPPPLERFSLKIFDGLVILGCLSYLLLYYFIVYRHLEPNAALYGQVPYNHLLVFIKNLLNYGLFSDPILILLLLPFTAWRIYKALRRQLELHPVYDSMLIAGSMLVLGYLALNIFNPNTLFPAYIFALPPLIYFFNQRKQKALFLKGVATIAGVALLFNVFPTGINYLTYYKYLSVNFNKTLNFIVKDIYSRYPRQRANIFLDAVDPNAGIASYFIFTEFLQYKKLSWQQFDFKSNVKIKDDASYLANNFLSRQPFTIFKGNKTFEISKGDYLVITPDSVTKNITGSYIQSLGQDYDLIFKTKSPLAFPDLNLKTLAKYILAKRLTTEQKKKGSMINENLTQSPDYYIFVKR